VCDLDAIDNRGVVRFGWVRATVEIELIVAETASSDYEGHSEIVCDLDVTDCGLLGRSKRLAMSAEIEGADMGLVRRRSVEFMTTLE
jgi:hypothetical protein